MDIGGCRGRSGGGGGNGRGRGGSRGRRGNHPPPPLQQQPQRRASSQIEPHQGQRGTHQGQSWAHQGQRVTHQGGQVGPCHGGGEGRGRGWSDSPSECRGTTGHVVVPPAITFGSFAPPVQSLRSSPPESALPGTVIPAMRSLTISEPSPAAISSPSGNARRLLPVKRPDKGGSSAVQLLPLRANFFAINYNSESIIWHYDLDIKPGVDPANGRPMKLSKSILTLVRNKLSSDIPLSMTAYDGVKNLFSAEPLPTGEFKVSLSEEGTKVRSFICTLKLVSELRLSKLSDYLRGNVLSVPRDILQGLDVIMNENPTRQMIRVGRRFYSTRLDWCNDLGQGIIASRGFQHSLKPTSQCLALCLDYSVSPFRKPIPVIKFLEEHIDGFSMNNFLQFRAIVEQALNKLKVTFTHRVTKLNFTIAGLSKENTRQISFPVQDAESSTSRNVGLVEYYKEKYGKDIRYLNVPCLELGKSRQNEVPMEFCELVAGQRYSKENLDKDAGKKLKSLSLVPPKEREDLTCRMAQDPDGPSGGEIARSFGIGVSPNMTTVTGRVLGPPVLKLRASGSGGQVIPTSVDKQKCGWNLVDKAVVEGKPVQRWAVLDFTSKSSGRYRFNDEEVIPKLIQRSIKLGIHMEEPLLYEPTTMHKLSNVGAIRALLDKINEQTYRIGRARLQILVCVMSQVERGYDYLKWYSETKLGLMTQCCLSSKLNEYKGQDQYLANLALKINAKLGGSNFELMDPLPHIGGGGHVMFIGADVNHAGSWNTTNPSIAAVVATMNWPAVSRYAARVWPQDNRTEKILKFGEKCLELLKAYVQLNNVKPERITVFRDGVSEGQFDMVLNEELMDLKRAFQAMNYFPTITLIVAQKRHHARLFLDKGTGNVLPGTVVDTAIIHQADFDFYLISHYGMIGTSKPTHYQVLWDENEFNSDDLQQLIYNMCFTFARCSKPVSLTPPVYYADLVAYRGQQYHQALLMAQSQSSSSASSSSSGSTEVSFDEGHYKLHRNLENSMFFI